MPIVSVDTWKRATSRWWSSRSPALVAVDTALASYHQNKTHERFIELARKLRAWMSSKVNWRKSTRNTGWNENVVADLVLAVAQSDYWRGAREGTDEGALAQYFRAAAGGLRASATFNREFMTGPEAFLRKYSVYCYNNDSYNTELATYDGLTGVQLGGRIALAFDFQLAEKYGTRVSLKIAAHDERGEDQVLGGWIPYTGQVATPNPDSFGHLAILSADYNYIFTVGLGGCRIAVVRAPNRVIHMYHEPTQTRWKTQPAYDGEVIAYCSPDYDRCLAGFCCFEKRARGWRAYVQEFGDGGSVARLQIQDLDI